MLTSVVTGLLISLAAALLVMAAQRYLAVLSRGQLVALAGTLVALVIVMQTSLPSDVFRWLSSIIHIPVRPLSMSARIWIRIALIVGILVGLASGRAIQDLVIEKEHKPLRERNPTARAGTDLASMGIVVAIINYPRIPGGDASDVHVLMSGLWLVITAAIFGNCLKAEVEPVSPYSGIVNILLGAVSLTLGLRFLHVDFLKIL
jgi:hypothetical protein